MGNFSCAATVFLGLTLGGIAREGAVTIKRVPKVDQAVNYSAKGSLSIGGEELDFAVQRSCDTVTEVRPDGSFTRKSVDSGVTLGGKPSEDSETSITTKSNGELMSVSGEAKESMARRLTLSLVYYPDHAVSAGDTWTFSGTKNDELGTKSFRSVEKYLGEETYLGKKTFKIEQDSQEIEGTDVPTYHATVWVDEVSGLTLKADATFKNLLFGALPVSGHLVYETIAPATKTAG